MILPFGSGDESVFLEAPLTSLASVTTPSVNTISAVGSELNTYASGSFDAVKGYKTPTTVGSGTRAGGIEYDLTTAYPASFDYAGQISFETEWQYVTPFAENADNLNAPFDSGTPTSHGGHDHENDAHSGRKEMISASPANSGGLSFAFYADGVAPDMSFVNLRKTQNNFTAYGRSLTMANGEFCRVTLAWTGNRREVHINGILAWWSDDCTNAVTYPAMRYFHVACGSGGFSPVVSGQHFRNLTLSTKPVSTSIHPLLDIACAGDSFFDNISGDIKNIKQASVDPYHSSAPYAMEWVFSNAGLNAEVDVNTGSNTGAVIYARGSNEINTLLPAMLSKNPRIVCYHGGTNDAIQYHLGNLTDLTLVNTQLKLDAATILDHPNVEYLVLTDVVTIGFDYKYFDSALGKAAVDTINGYINGLQDAMTAIDTKYAGRIRVAKMFEKFGGHTLTNDAGYFAEVALGGDVHPGSYGSWEMGVLYGNEIVHAISAT